MMLETRGSDSRAQAIRPTTEIQRSLPPDTALIEYVVGKQTLSILLITPLSVIGLPVSIASESLSSRTELLRDLIMERRSEWIQPARGLCTLLLRPVQSAGYLKGDPPVADRPRWRPELCAVRRVANQPISIPGRRVHGCLSAFGGGFGDRIGWKKQWKEVACDGSICHTFAQCGRRSSRYRTNLPAHRSSGCRESERPKPCSSGWRVIMTTCTLQPMEASTKMLRHCPH